MSHPTTHLLPAHHVYLAETLSITILPLVPLPALPLITHPIPAMHPPHRATVPLWLALLLKKQGKAHIIPPPWLTTDNLNQLIKWEVENPGRFGEGVPWRWVELGEVLCEAAEDDLVAASGGGQAGLGAEGERDVRVLLRTLREVRWSKAREGLRGLEATYLQMNALGHLEISELRPYAKAVVDNLRLITASKEEAKAREEEEEEERERRRGSRYGTRGAASSRGGMDDDDDED
ncbi:hypothetical protein DFH27DRAFT_285106 [Peziza echinospora]|nr:hypothetical protein DFH27DRAFT_285106 [Peziza echinospora]